MKKMDKMADSTLLNHKSVDVEVSGTFSINNSPILSKKSSNMSRR